MNIKAGLSILVGLLGQILLVPVVVESGRGSIISSFFRGPARGGARGAAEAAGDGAVQTIASGMGSNNPYRQSYGATDPAGSGTGGLTTSDLDILASIVQEILRSPTYYQQINCGLTSYQTTMNPDCSFVTCCIEEGRGSNPNTRAIGQDCVLELMVQNIIMYPSVYQQLYCVAGVNSPDCQFVNCSLNGYKAGSQSTRSIGKNWYLSSYQTSSATSACSLSISSTSFCAAVILASVSVAVMGFL